MSVCFLMQFLPWKNITSLFVLRCQEVEAGWPQLGLLAPAWLAGKAWPPWQPQHISPWLKFAAKPGHFLQNETEGRRRQDIHISSGCSRMFTNSRGVGRPASAPSSRESMSSWSQTSAPAPSLPNFPSPPPQFLRALPLYFVPPFQPVAHSLPPTPWLLPPSSSHPALIRVSSTMLGPDPRPGKSSRKPHIHSSGLLGPCPECTKAKLVLIFLSLGQCC